MKLPTTPQKGWDILYSNGTTMICEYRRRHLVVTIKVDEEGCEVSCEKTKGAIGDRDIQFVHQQFKLDYP